MATRAPSTIITLPINGQTEFNIPFEFLARRFVAVTLLGVTRQELTLNTHYRFISSTRIQLIQAVDETQYPRIELRRNTSTTDRLVTFVDGSILRATDMNLAQVQTMHVAEEARDLTADSIGVNDEGNLDARNRKVVNVANATDTLDAVNLSQLRQFDTSTANNADRAEAAKTLAVASEAGAIAAKDGAQTFATNAETSAMTALASESGAITSASQASASASQASASASQASASASLALQHATTAGTEADRAETEANKLANFNGLAAAIDEVNPTSYTVVWKGDIVTGQGASVSTTASDVQTLKSKTTALTYRVSSKALQEITDANLIVKGVSSPALGFVDTQAGANFAISVSNGFLKLGTSSNDGILTMAGLEVGVTSMVNFPTLAPTVGGFNVPVVVGGLTVNTANFDLHVPSRYKCFPISRNGVGDITLTFEGGVDFATMHVSISCFGGALLTGMVVDSNASNLRIQTRNHLNALQDCEFTLTLIKYH